MLKEQNTIYVNNILYFNIVKIFVLIYNLQITNVKIKFLSKFINNKLFKLNVLVGISETICSLLTLLNLKIIKKKYLLFSNLNNSSSSLKEKNFIFCNGKQNMNDSNSFNE